MAELYRSDIVNVDISKSLLRTYAGIVLATGDKNANRFGANIFRAGEPVDLTGCTVLAYFIRPNADTLPIDGKVEGNTAYVDLPAACYTSDGAFSLAIKISSTEITQTVRVVDGCIRLTQTDNLVDPGEVVPSLDELFATIAAMETAANAARETADDAAATAAEARQVVKDAATPIVVDVNGGIIAVTDGAERPVVGLVSTITATQAGTGDPDPDNVRAIAGWDSVAVHRTGANLVSLTDYTTTNGHTATVITADAIDVAMPSVYDYGRLPVSIKAGVTYTLVIDWEVYGRDESATGETRASFRLNELDSGQQQYSVYANQARRIVRVYRPEADADTFLQWNPNYGSAVPASSRSRVMLLVGEYTADTAPEFVPGQGVTLNAALPETVYGGRLDWTNGVLTVTHRNIAAYAGETVPDGWISSVGALTDGAQVVYPLAEPYTIQLDPQTMDMLKGCNALWSDCGDTAVSYVADTKIYIDNKFAALQNAILAQGANI